MIFFQNFLVLFCLQLVFSDGQRPIEIPLGTELLSISYVINEEIITFTASSEKMGYIGFGFSNKSGMTEADMFIGGVNDQSGELYSGVGHFI